MMVVPVLRLAAFGLWTLLLYPFQFVALKTGSRLSKTIPVLYHRVVLSILGVRVKETGTMSQRHPLLIIANHISWLDIVVFGSLAPLCFIAKAEVRHWPVFGPLSKLQRSVFVERSLRTKSAEQAGEIADRLVNGDVMVLFAEGTTGDANRLLPFKSSLLGAAQAALIESPEIDAVTVQPVSIAYVGFDGLPAGRINRRGIGWIGDEEFMPSLRRILSYSAIDCVISFSEPMLFAEGGDRKRIMRDAEDAISASFAAANRGARATRNNRRAAG